MDQAALGRYAADAGRRRLDVIQHPLPPGMRERVLDVEYNDLVADPLATAERALAHFDLPRDEHLRRRMQAWMEAHPRHQFGKHRYTLEQFGLDRAQVEALSVAGDTRLPRSVRGRETRPGRLEVVSAGPTLSVVIATHARAASLARALETIAAADRRGLDVEVVVVENGPPCGVDAIVRARQARLPLRYVHLPEANKAAADNCALDAGGLGEIVVFTDDDVTVDAGWLQAIAAACERWPERSVFGGRIELRWPDVAIPTWAREDAWVRAFAFAQHDLGSEPVAYEGDLFPYGPNWWARRAIFDAGGASIWRSVRVRAPGFLARRPHCSGVWRMPARAHSTFRTRWSCTRYAPIS